MALGINGPIPVIVVDQFGYPTRASKIAVIRDPKEGYDDAAHFTPGAIYALVGGYLRELTRKAEVGEFSLGPMLMALIGRKREKKRA